MNAKRVISFVLPQTVAEGVTALGQKYEVNFENGLKVLNSENSNYSFGSLHQIMLKGLNEVLKKNSPKKILMLGLGAGSALQVLRNKCKWPYHVTIVEIDNDLIELARLHFELDSHVNTTIINTDAKLAIQELKGGDFDLILDDIFWDDQIPEFCLKEDYLNSCSKCLVANGIYLRNTMPTPEMDFEQFEFNLAHAFSSHYSIKHAVYGNKIYFCQL
jgi:spermidine synthase